MRASKRLAALLPLALLLGCGGEFRMAPVSGVVTLDGEPLVNASLYFQPQRAGSEPVVGPPSIGVTDEAGRYRLRAQTNDTGAVVGQHVVSITTFESRMVDPQNSDRVEIVSKERVPPRYRAPSELRFTVPSSGADDANFDLTSG